MTDIMTKEELYYPGAGNNSDDFIGFSFNGIRSQDLGISRVSEGTRYGEQMLPGFQDKSAQMPGSDYTLYWESFYNTRAWNLNIAFDHMTDSQISLLRKTFHTKNMGELTFAEREGIHWLAKVQAPPQLKYICFDEGGKRIYKGEGTIQLIAYYPFGMSDLHTLSVATTGTTVTNNGEIPMEWYVIAPVTPTPSSFEIKAETEEDSEVRILRFNDGIEFKTGDVSFMVNSKTNLVEGLDRNNKQTGNVYNSFITAGDFFKLPVGSSTFFSTGTLYYNFLYL